MRKRGLREIKGWGCLLSFPSVSACLSPCLHVVVCNAQYLPGAASNRRMFIITISRQGGDKRGAVLHSFQQIHLV